MIRFAENRNPFTVKRKFSNETLQPYLSPSTSQFRIFVLARRDARRDVTSARGNGGKETMYANAMGRMRIKSETQKARRPRSLCFQGISGTSPTSTMTRDTPLKQTRRPVSTPPFYLPASMPLSPPFISSTFPPPFPSFSLSVSKRSRGNVPRTFRDIFFSLPPSPFSSHFPPFRKFVYPSFFPSRRFKSCVATGWILSAGWKLRLVPGSVSFDR